MQKVIERVVLAFFTVLVITSFAQLAHNIIDPPASVSSEPRQVGPWENF